MRKNKADNIKNIAIKYRLYPNNSQTELLNKTFGCCRKIWNLMLADKISYYKETGHILKNTPAQYKTDYPYLKEVDSSSLANVQINLQRALSDSSKTKKKRKGFPKFKSLKKSKKSYTTNCINNNIRLNDNHITLPKLGQVKIKLHRKPEPDWVLKSATVSKNPDGTYYVSVLFEYESNVTNIAKPNISKAIGLDYKSDGLYMDSNNNIGTNHKFYRESYAKLAKAQRRLSRKIGSKKNETKSNNYKKQLLKVNKIHRRIANQRLDNLHKISTEIANQYDIVCVETLNMRAMSNKGFKNGKSTMDNGYGMFLTMLAYKLSNRGKYFVKVDKWFSSSQLCSCCGKKHPEMKIRYGNKTKEFLDCSCGAHIQRDYNAAINILHEGLRMLNIC